MSGIFIRRNDAGLRESAAAAKRLSFTAWTKSMTAQSGGFSFGLTWIGHDDFRPYYRDSNNKVTLCMLGRLYDARDEVRLDKRFARIAAEYRALGYRALKTINGAGVLLLFDEKEDKCLFITDRQAFFPLFVAFEKNTEKIALCSHSDILAASYPEELALEEVSMAAYLFNGSANHPSTFYRDIRFLDHASVYEWTAGGIRKLECYWRPEPKLDTSDTLTSLGKELADALARAVNLRFREADGPGGLMLSGGLDSRAMLFAAEPPRDNIIGITFADSMNEETKIAAKVATRAGIRHEIMFRGPEYYAEIIPDAARISGGMWDMSHAHSAGFSERINNLGLNLVTSGYNFDMLFRGWAVETRTVKSRFLPPRREFAPFGSNDTIKRFPPDGSPFASEIMAQRDALTAHINKERYNSEDRLRAEFPRITPTSRMTTLVEFTLPWRTMAFDLVACDDRLLDLFCRIPPEMKINGDIIIEALKNISKESLKIIYSNTGAHVAAPSFIQAIEHVIRKKMRKRWKKENITIGSWGAWTDIIRRSALLRQYWQENRKTSENLLTYLAGRNPYDTPYEDWALDRKNVRFFRRSLFLAMWLKHRIRRGEE